LAGIKELGWKASSNEWWQMTEIKNQPVVHEASAIDDLRRIRTRFDQESHGDLRRHVAESRRITEQLREKLGLKIAPSRTLPAAMPSA
jgi:hypothetical protein